MSNTVVIIEGSTTPAAGVLARGERREVPLTSRIQRLIDKGFVILVATVTKAEEPKKASFGFQPVPAPVVEEPVEDLRTEQERYADEQAQAARDELGVPKGNASRVEWQQFLESKGIEVPEEATRDDLIDLWQQWDGGAQ